jgi:hypothetical protein
MSDASVTIFLSAFIGIIVVVLMTGRFLSYLERDNPAKFNEIWSGSDRAWNFFYPVRVPLLYVLPKTYKLWGLSQKANRLAARLRVVTFVSIIWFLAAFTVYVIEFV